MLTLYHIPRFRSTRALWMYLELANLYKDRSVVPTLRVKEFVDIDRYRNDKPDWYLKLNPNGKVPTFVDENQGITMWESGAVCFHLLEQYDKDHLLLPQDAKQRALYQQLAFFTIGTMDNLNATSSPVQRGVNLANPGKPARMNPDPKDEKIVAAKTAWQTYIGPFFEGLLGEHDGPFVLGKTFTALDLIIASGLFGIHEKCITRGDGISWLDKSATPRVITFYDEVRKRDCWKVAVADTKDWTPFKDKGLVLPILERAD